MSDTTQTNAMAEIALALAMGFFSIMVLTMVSMGSGLVTQTEQASLKDTPISVAQTSDKPDTQKAQGSTENVKPTDLVIFHNGQFLDHNLKSLSVQTLNSREKVVLAVNPDLSMSKTMAARGQIKSQNITVVVLNETWLTALKEAQL